MKNLLCKACVFDIQHCHVELYINPANLAPGVKYGPTPGGHYRTLTLLDDFFHVNQNGRKEDTQSRQELFC